MLTRRQLLIDGAGASAALGLIPFNLHGDALHETAPIVKDIPGTNEFLPVIGLGTNRWVAAGSREAMTDLRATLSVFATMGGKVIDTAPSYRSSEQALGQLIAESGPTEPFFLATKVDRDTRHAGIARMENSMQTLGTRTIDLMQIHSLRGAEAQIDALAEWKETGRIRYVGITTSNKDQFAEMEQLMTRMPLDFVQLNYSLQQRDAEQRLLPLAKERGMAVMVNRPFAHGQLFRAAANEPLPGWATETCASWPQFFLKYVVSHPAVTCAIPGTTKAQHVRDNMGANFGALPDAAFRRRQEEWLASI